MDQSRCDRDVRQGSYAKKSSTTVDNVLKIIAFMGMCATLCIGNIITCISRM